MKMIIPGISCIGKLTKREDIHTVFNILKYVPVCGYGKAGIWGNYRHQISLELKV